MHLGAPDTISGRSDIVCLAAVFEKSETDPCRGTAVAIMHLESEAERRKEFNRWTPSFSALLTKLLGGCVVCEEEGRAPKAQNDTVSHNGFVQHIFVCILKHHHSSQS